MPRPTSEVPTIRAGGRSGSPKGRRFLNAEHIPYALARPPSLAVERPQVLPSGPHDLPPMETAAADWP